MAQPQRQGIFNIKLNSRRERLIYWGAAIGVFMYLVAVGVLLLAATNIILETSAFYGVILGGFSYYIKKESDVKSDKPM